MDKVVMNRKSFPVYHGYCKWCNWRSLSIKRLLSNKKSPLQCYVFIRRPFLISGGSRGGARPPLFLDQTEARRAEKNCFWDRSPHYLRVWLTAPPPPLSEGLDPPLLIYAPHDSYSKILGNGQKEQNLSIYSVCCFINKGLRIAACSMSSWK